jgi:hypothetical protein
MEDADTTAEIEEQRKKPIDPRNKERRTKAQESSSKSQPPNNKRSRCGYSRKSRSSSLRMKASSWWANPSRSLRSSAKRTTATSLESKTDRLHSQNV